VTQCLFAKVRYYPYPSARDTIPLLLSGGRGPDWRPGDLAGRQVLRHEHGHQAQEVLGPSQAGRLNIHLFAVVPRVGFYDVKII
jgi:hypothetical protein